MAEGGGGSIIKVGGLLMPVNRSVGWSVGSTHATRFNIPLKRGGCVFAMQAPAL
jgi:hypothetical protein